MLRVVYLRSFTGCKRPLRLELIKKGTFGFSVLSVTIPKGLPDMCLGQLFVSVLCFQINTFYTKNNWICIL